MRFKQFLTEAKKTYILPPKMKGNFKIVGGLDNVENWKAKVILNNNPHEEDDSTGKIKPVGYIGVSTKTNMIVPIARDDEHRAGYELLQHLIEKKLVPKAPDETYVTLFPSSNFIYGHQLKKHTEQNIKAYQNWLDMGGPDLSLQGTNGINYEGTISDFIKRIKEIKTDGDVVLNIDEIFPKGQVLIKELTELAIMYSRIENSGGRISHSLEAMKKRFIERGIKFVNDLGGYRSGYPERLILDFDKFKKRIGGDASEFDVGDVIFGMNGIKNIIHRALKAILNKKKLPKEAWSNGEDYYLNGFGNIKKAIEEFNKMGQI